MFKKLNKEIDKLKNFKILSITRGYSIEDSRGCPADLGKEIDRRCTAKGQLTKASGGGKVKRPTDQYYSPHYFWPFATDSKYMMLQNDGIILITERL